MKSGKFNSRRYCERIKWKLILGDKKFICRKFSKDTRIIEEGDIYIAIKGEKFDGNKFWREL